MPTHKVRLPGSLTGRLTGRRAPVDLGYIHFCAESCTHISAMERAVLEHVARGRSSKEVGVIMGMSTDVAQKVSNRLLRKLGARDKTQLALTAVASGLIDNPRQPFGTKGT